MTLGNLKLRPVRKDDLPYLFECYCDTDSSYLWQQERYILSELEFFDFFNNKIINTYYIFFIVEKVDNSERHAIGFTYLHKQNIIDGIGYLCLYLDRDNVNKRQGKVAGYLILEFLFTNYSFRKVYTEVFEFNYASQKLQNSNGFKLEAVLKFYRFYKDKYWDLLILSITREDFQNHKESVILSAT